MELSGAGACRKNLKPPRPFKRQRDIELPKSFKTFWEKEKPTLKQIRQLSLSYLQNPSRFDVVGNKGLARSDSDGAASVCASVT